jgi:hypothetical protein
VGPRVTLHEPEQGLACEIGIARPVIGRDHTHLTGERDPRRALGRDQLVDRRRDVQLGRRALGQLGRRQVAERAQHVVQLVAVASAP